MTATTQQPPSVEPSVAQPSQQQDEIVNPLVFQCKKCRVIVGDSFAWLSADEELNVVTLVSCNLAAVTVHQDMQFATDGVDAGSAFHTICCVECKQNIGRKYQATPRKWDHLRDMFTFNLDALISYQLGTSSNSSPVDSMATMPSAMELRTNIAKLQTTVMQLSDRIMMLEKYIKMAEERRKKLKQ